MADVRLGLLLLLLCGGGTRRCLAIGSLHQSQGDAFGDLSLPLDCLSAFVLRCCSAKKREKVSQVAKHAVTRHVRID